jgi:TRAF3-interacting protein 1
MEEEIGKTQKMLGSLITSPVLTEKLLLKPPLRFLHDVFVALLTERGLMTGLFDEDEVAWKANVANDKDAKAFFIAKV